MKIVVARLDSESVISAERQEANRTALFRNCRRVRVFRRRPYFAIDA